MHNVGFNCTGREAVRDCFMIMLKDALSCISIQSHVQANPKFNDAEDEIKKMQPMK